MYTLLVHDTVSEQLGTRLQHVTTVITCYVVSDNWVDITEKYPSTEYFNLNGELYVNKNVQCLLTNNNNEINVYYYSVSFTLKMKHY